MISCHLDHFPDVTKKVVADHFANISKMVNCENGVWKGDSLSGVPQEVVA